MGGGGAEEKGGVGAGEGGGGLRTWCAVAHNGTGIQMAGFFRTELTVNINLTSGFQKRKLQNIHDRIQKKRHQQNWKVTWKLKMSRGG